MRYHLGYDAPIGHMAVDFTEDSFLGLSFCDETLDDISSCPEPPSKEVKEWLLKHEATTILQKKIQVSKT